MDLDPILRRIIAAVEDEGRRLLAEFHRPRGPRGRHATAPIDTEIEHRLRELLQSLVPCAFLGEETGAAPGALEGWLWLVDPHDGTKAFLEGRRGSAVSVGLLRARMPVLGVVHCPNAPDLGPDTVAWAEGCGPVIRNGAPVDAQLGVRALSAREFVWATASSALRPASYSRAVAPARYIAMPSIAYRLARVAAGDGVAAMSIHSVNEYDIAAGAALVRGAGGVVLDAEAREIAFTGEPEARVSGCFAGSAQAVRALARFDWRSLGDEAKSPARAPTGFPAVSDPERLSRAQGSLSGLLIGDNLGSLVQLRSAAEIRETFPKGVRELADGGRWGLIAGQPSGEGELALALARSLVREGRFDPAAVLAAYRGWTASAPFDTGTPAQPGPSADGAGAGGAAALARVSPIGIWAAGDPERAARSAREEARLAQRQAACVEACAALCAALATGVETASRRDMAAAALHALEPGAAEVRAAIERGVQGELPDADAGEAPAALQGAFRALFHAGSLEEGLTETVSRGGAADANGATAGALLGACHGIKAVPRRWLFHVLACRPGPEADAFRARPMEYWPDDVLELAESLLKALPPPAPSP